MLNTYELDANLLVKDPKELLNLPATVLVNKFNEASAKAFYEDFARAADTNKTVVPVYIDSYGGECYSLLAMVDIMRSFEIPIATIALSKAMSCGSVLLSCGDEGMRFASPSTTIMIHEVSSGQFGKNPEIQASAEETERLNVMFIEMMATNIGKPKDYFKKIIHDKSHADWFLTAKDAKSHGLVNHIRVPKFNTKVSIETAFG